MTRFQVTRPARDDWAIERVEDDAVVARIVVPAEHVRGLARALETVADALHQERLKARARAGGAWQ